MVWLWLVSFFACSEATAIAKDSREVVNTLHYVLAISQVFEINHSSDKSDLGTVSLSAHLLHVSFFELTIIPISNSTLVKSWGS